MADFNRDAIELMSSIKSRREKLEFKPSLTDSNYQFDQTADGEFTISQRYLRLANSENGVVSCQGYYYNGGGYTYDPPQFYELRLALARQGYISLNISEQLSCDVVISPFRLNGACLNVGDRFGAAIWHANRVSS